MPSTPLHICYCVYDYQRQFTSPKELLDVYHSLTKLAEALVCLGVKVSVVGRFYESSEFVQDGIQYYFIADHFGTSLRPWQLPRSVHQRIAQLAPDAVHTHNFNKVLQHWHLGQTLSWKIPIAIQNHAEWPAKRLRILLQRWLYQYIAAFVFCAPGQEQAWAEVQIIRNPERVYFVMEGSTHFQPLERAKTENGLKGDPVFLWVGHLDQNKDPLTILRAFTRLLPDYPRAQLYMIYLQAPLLREVTQLLEEFPDLKGAVHLLGGKPREALAGYFNGAHYFLLGSHREGSGYSMMEALACGCVPVVSDIPSFRMMTKEGSLGALFSPGDTEGAYRAMLAVLEKDWATDSQACRTHFQDQLSYPAIARDWLKIYQQISSYG